MRLTMVSTCLTRVRLAFRGTPPSRMVLTVSAMTWRPICTSSSMRYMFCPWRPVTGSMLAQAAVKSGSRVAMSSRKRRRFGCMEQ